MYLSNAFKWEIFTQGQWSPRYGPTIRSILCLKPIFASIKCQRTISWKLNYFSLCRDMGSIIFVAQTQTIWVLTRLMSIDWQPDRPAVSKPGQDRTGSYSSKLPLDRGSERLFRLPFSICRWIALPGSARAHTFNYTAHLHFNCRQTQRTTSSTIAPPGAETRWHCG